MKCQVCGSTKTRLVGNYQPYLDYSVDVFDCGDCLSRFAPHDGDAHEKLHSQSSKYFNHKEMEAEIANRLRMGDVSGAKSCLSKRTANSFVIDTVDSVPSAGNLLEIGCSRGFLAGYFLSSDRKVLGVDISTTAISAAVESFGDHFCVADDPRIEAGAPYDVIYHVGTIGCIAFPVEMTKELLGLLKPGGLLVFNAPNRICCETLERMWLSTPPPDLVNLFHPEFWSKIDLDVAETKIKVQNAGRLASGYIRMFANLEAKPVAKLFDDGNVLQPTWGSKRVRQLKTLYNAFAFPPLPEEYGIHVVLKRKS